jgi:hypothetical protein
MQRNGSHETPQQEQKRQQRRQPQVLRLRCSRSAVSNAAQDDVRVEEIREDEKTGARTTTKADPYGMTNKRTSNGNSHGDGHGNSDSDGKQQRQRQRQICGGTSNASP